MTTLTPPHYFKSTEYDRPLQMIESHLTVEQRSDLITDPNRAKF